MKKNLKSVLCLVFALALVLQLGGGLAFADDRDELTVSGSEDLVLCPQVMGENNEARAVTADDNLSFSLKLKDTAADDPDAKPRDMAEGGSFTMKDLMHSDLTLTPPEGYFVHTIILLAGEQNKDAEYELLPLSSRAAADSAVLKIGHSTFVIKEDGKDDSFNTAVISLPKKGAEKSYGRYSLIVCFAKEDTEATLEVSYSNNEKDSGKAGDSFTIKSGVSAAGKEFRGWLLSYDNGSSLLMQPGDTLKPYTSCKLDAQWTSLLSVSAASAVTSFTAGDTLNFANFSTLIVGELPEGYEVRNVRYRVSRDGADVEDGAVLSEGEYQLSVASAEVCSKESGEAADEGLVKVEYGQSVVLTVTAAAPAPTETPAPTEEPKPTETPAPTEEPKPTETPAPTEEPKPTETPAPTEEPKPTETPAPIDYAILDGAGATYTKSSGTALTIRVDCDFAKFANLVTLDGKPLEAKDYTASSGSTVIALQPALLDSLSAGSHNVEIAFSDGSAKTSFTVAEAPAATGLPLELRAKNQTLNYSGVAQAIVQTEYTLSGLAEGDEATVTLKIEKDGKELPSVTDAGTYDIVPTVEIKNGGSPVAADKYKITTAKATLTVKKQAATFSAFSAKAQTDGKTVVVAAESSFGSYVNGYKVEGLLSGHKVDSIKVNGSGSESFATSIEKDSIKIVDGSGNDVTANYEITTVDGYVTIEVKSKANVKLTITALDQNWTYDAQAHTVKQDSYSIEGLEDGDVATVTLSVQKDSTTLSEVVNAGTYTIVPSVTIRTKSGAAVSEDKYLITLVNGTLTVKQFDLTLEAVSDSKTYDGKALVNSNVKATALCSGDKFRDKDGVKFSVTDSKGNLVTNGVINVGVYTKKVTEVHIVNAKGEDVTANYNIKKIDGTLTIKSGSTDKNNSTTPKTGDNSNLGLLIGLLIGSAVLIAAIAVVLVILQRKKRLEEAANAEATLDYPDDFR